MELNCILSLQTEKCYSEAVAVANALGASALETNKIPLPSEFERENKRIEFTPGTFLDSKLLTRTIKASTTGSVIEFSVCSGAPELFKKTNKPPILFEIPSNSFIRLAGALCVAS